MKADEARRIGDCMYCGRTAQLVRVIGRGGTRGRWHCYACDRPAFGSKSHAIGIDAARIAAAPLLKGPSLAPVEPEPAPIVPPQIDLVTRYHAEVEPERDPLATDHGAEASAEAKATKLTRAQKAGAAAFGEFVSHVGTKGDAARFLGCRVDYVHRMLAGEMAPWPLAKLRIGARLIAAGQPELAAAIQAWKAGS